MADKQRKTGPATRVVLTIALVGVVLFALRMMAPGGGDGPGVTPAPQPSASPAPAAAPAPAPATVEKPVQARAPEPTKAAPRTSSLRGVVRFSGGVAAEGAVVEVIATSPDEDDPVVVIRSPSSAEGVFQADGLPNPWAGVSLHARKGPLRVSVELDGPGLGEVLANLRFPDTFDISGLVVGAEDGRPLEGMKVSVGDLSVKTDSLGRFTLARFAASLLNGALPALKVSGAGRYVIRRPLDVDEALDDSMIPVEQL